MELEEFVKKSMLDITNGVFKAKQSAELAIAPGFIEGERILAPQMIDFEIAVTTSAEGGGGITVWSAVNVKGGMSSEHVNKIAFSVPVYFQAMNPRGEPNSPREK